MNPAKFLAKVRAKQRARAAAAPAPEVPAVAPVSVDDDSPLDPAWVAEEERADAAAERQREVSVGDGEFATAVWLIQIDGAFHEANGASPSRRIARIISLGAASGLTDGQLAALQRLRSHFDAAAAVLGAAERGRAVPRPQTFYGSRRF